MNMQTENSLKKTLWAENIAENNLPVRRKNSGNHLAWLVWLVSATFVLFQFFLQLTSGEMVAGLMKSFSLSAFGGGFLASAYYYIYVTLQTPAGLLIDRYGPRKLLSLGAIIVAFGSLLFASAQHLSLAIFGRMLMGGGAAFAFVGSISLISRWFPPHRFGIMTAIAETVGMLGSLIGGFFLAELVETWGWQNCIFGAAAIAFIIAILLWNIVRDMPKDGDCSHIAIPTRSFREDLREILGQKIAWINGIYSGLMFCVVTVFVALWAIPFFETEHQLTLTQSSLTANMVFIGIAVGGPILGWLDSRYAIRRFILVSSSLTATLLMVSLIYLPHLSTTTVAVLMLVLGMVCSAYVLNFVVGNEIATLQTRSTSIGLVNTLSVGTAPILQPLVGYVLYVLHHHQTIVGATPAYTLREYQIALLIVPLMTLISAGLAFFIPPRPANTAH